MINLRLYREFWDELAQRIPDVSGVMGVTVDEDMVKRIQGLTRGSVTLFWLPPSATGMGRNADSYREKSRCIVFVMEKYDPARMGSLEVLERTQRAIERVKALLLDSQRSGCSPLRLSAPDFSTLPETKFFAGFAGWSIAFDVESPIDTESYYPRVFSRIFTKVFN